MPEPTAQLKQALFALERHGRTPERGGSRYKPRPPPATHQAGPTPQLRRRRPRSNADRFAQLVTSYDTTAADLLPDTDRPLIGAEPITLLVDRLHQLPPILHGPISRYVATVLAARNTPTATQVTIRRSDLFVLAPAAGTTPEGLVSQPDRS